MTADGGDDLPAGSSRGAADLVHDLRTPLTIVLGFADLLRKRGDALGDAERTEFVERIDAAAKDMKRILDAQRPPA